MDRLLSMRVFQKVVDEGGFAAAARALDMSPAAVTRLFGDLEHHLGARLMQRTTRKLALTEAGEMYLLRVRGILGEIADAEAAVGHSTQELQGTVHILASPVLAAYVLAPQVAKWRQRYPKVALEISVDPFPHNRVDEFDVTFMAVDEGYDANVVARPLATSDWVLCAAPAYLQRAGTPLQPHDLSSHDYLKFPWQQAGGTTNRRLRLHPANGKGEPVEVDVPVALQSVSFDVLYRAALDGAGVAVLSRLMVEKHLARGDLVHLLPDWVFGRLTVFAAVPSRKLLPARTRAFLDFLNDGLPAQNRAFAPGAG
ncbi:LysR family transcriptional regulator [Candidatus Aalborgicola defluviihabitans]|jgi:DNA-binding transcriptional LysR family regulator|uniref:LysR family transcriptional regulator n=1 Tax=Candidatus Aalborgicola defluviihabitans TaxID=3386187 RepID=UPI001D862DB5|nr:LysR family transcriptional regulator [Burkholderiales bacterium]MBK7279353.1 LysR family transcriptional regulator [Burkholderiales bacterium]MBK7312953.1 LysR family transcriptional regulator [Burkholderiales bacterium]